MGSGSFDGGGLLTGHGIVLDRRSPRVDDAGARSLYEPLHDLRAQSAEEVALRFGEWGGWLRAGLSLSFRV